MFIAASALLALISAGIVASNAADNNTPGPVGAVAPSDEAEGKHQEEENKNEAFPSEAAWKRRESDRFDKALSGDTHLQVIAALCALLLVVHHDILLILALVPFFGALLVRVGGKIGLNDAIEGGAKQLWANIEERSHNTVNIVVAGSLRKFVKLLFTSDRMFISGLRYAKCLEIEAIAGTITTVPF